MNRWMKRRIERSRERCDKAENQKRESKTRNGKSKETDSNSSPKVGIFSSARAA
jgi:hypothetical protein